MTVDHLHTLHDFVLSETIEIIIDDIPDVLDNISDILMIYITNSFRRDYGEFDSDESIPPSQSKSIVSAQTLFNKYFEKYLSRDTDENQTLCQWMKIIINMMIYKIPKYLVSSSNFYHPEFLQRIGLIPFQKYSIYDVCIRILIINEIPYYQRYVTINNNLKDILIPVTVIHDHTYPSHDYDIHDILTHISQNYILSDIPRYIKTC